MIIILIALSHALGMSLLTDATYHQLAAFDSYEARPRSPLQQRIRERASVISVEDEIESGCLYRETQAIRTSDVSLLVRRRTPCSPSGESSNPSTTRFVREPAGAEEFDSIHNVCNAHRYYFCGLEGINALGLSSYLKDRLPGMEASSAVMTDFMNMEQEATISISVF